MVDQVMEVEEKILSIGGCEEVSFKAQPLTERQRRAAKELYILGYCDKVIARKLNVEWCQIKYWRQVRKWVANKEDKDLPDEVIKETLPSFATPCITLAKDKYLAELDLQRWGNDVKPVSAPLSERSRALNLGGQIVGLAYRK